MQEKTPLDLLEIEDLPEPWGDIANKIGLDRVKIVFKEYPKIALYVPDFGKNEKIIRRWLQEETQDGICNIEKKPKEIARKLNVSTGFIYRIINSIKGG